MSVYYAILPGFKLAEFAGWLTIVYVIIMNRKSVWLEANSRNFEATANGVRWEAVIFSSEFCRNKSYFDVYKLLRWANKLEKILLNNVHTGKYFPNQTDRITRMEVKTDDNGITECYAVVESTNPEKKANPEMVTGFSIELMVEAKDVISNENGEYYIDFEWVGLAYLLGQLAGSGDTRILSTKTFNQNIIMNEKQIKELLEVQKTEFNEKLDQIKAEFATETMARKSQVKTDGSMSWVADNGVTYTETWQNIYTSMVTALETETLTGAQVMEYLAGMFNLKTFSGVADPEPTKEAEEPSEGENELTKIENALNHAEQLRTNMSEANEPMEVVSDHRGALNPAITTSKQFYSQIQNQIKNQILNNK